MTGKRNQVDREAGGRSGAQRRALRALPPVHALVEALDCAGEVERYGRGLCVRCAREVIEEARREIVAVAGDDGAENGDEPEAMTGAAILPGRERGREEARTPTPALPRRGRGREEERTPTPALPCRGRGREEERGLLDRARALLAERSRRVLEPVINATGIIVHTGLGRAPIAAAAAAAMSEAAAGYVPIELELSSGARGRRSEIVRGMLCELTGAESATVVNNGAAAMMIVLSALAKDRAVIVSRGELVEIGGSYRLPDVVAAGGAVLREVGTTNKTRRRDYERAIDEMAGAILKVHPSNFRVEGFTEDASIEELALLGREHRLPVIFDVGSGVLNDEFGALLPGDDPTVRSAIEAGADLVIFSGDKLLGGPQAGVIVGRAELIARIEQHPMMRAMRIGKVIMAGLEATLRMCCDPERARREAPVLVMAQVDQASLRRRADRVAEGLRERCGDVSVRCCETEAYMGGGSTPMERVASTGVAVTVRGVEEGVLAERLRRGSPRVVARLGRGEVIFDLRTVFEEQDAAMVEAIVRAAHVWDVA